MGLLVKERLLCKEKSASLFALKVFLKARESTESSEYKSLQLNTSKFFLACYKLSRIEAISKSHLPLIQWQMELVEYKLCVYMKHNAWDSRGDGEGSEYRCDNTLASDADTYC